MRQVGPVIGEHGLDRHGIGEVSTAYWNLSGPALYEQAICRREGLVAEGGALVVRTGDHTGRSPKDRFIVEEAASKADICWGDVNVAISEGHFESVRERMLAYLKGRDVFVQDLHAGADPEYRLPVRVITESAWNSQFARNMFLRPRDSELAAFEPSFTILQAPGCHAVPAADGTRSEVFVLVSFARRMVLIGGTSYAGEIKKSVFSILNYLLPARDVLPMHCAANIGRKGDCAI